MAVSLVSKTAICVKRGEKFSLETLRQLHVLELEVVQDCLDTALVVQSGLAPYSKLLIQRLKWLQKDHQSQLVKLG